MDSSFRRKSASIPTEGQPISNARLVAELQAVTLGIHMFGLDGLANMSGERVQEEAESAHVGPSPQPDDNPRETLGTEGGE